MKINTARVWIKFISAFLIVLLAAGVTSPAPVFADAAGPNLPTTGTNVPGIGTDDWDDFGSITLDDDVYASVRLSGGVNDTSQFLQGTGFGFSIPANAVIQGIEVIIGRDTNFQDGVFTSYMRDAAVHLVKDNVILTGHNKAITDTDWPISEAPQTYGGASDLWDTTWTPAEINAGNFGVALAAVNTATGTTTAFNRIARVDYMQITVTYSAPAGTSISVSAVTTTYGSTAALTAQLAPAVSGLEVDFSLDGVFACSATTDTAGEASCTSPVVMLDVGTYTGGVAAEFAGNAEYLPSSGSADLTVEALDITVTATDVTKTYGEPDPELTYTYEPELVGSDTFTGELTRDPGENVGIYGIRQGSLVLSSNYDLTIINGDFHIDPLTITVTAVADSKTYGEPDPELAYTYEPELVGSDTFTGELTREPGENVGDYDILQGSLALNSNYLLNFEEAVFSIDPLAITVTADNKTKAYGAPDPELTYTLSPDLIGDDELTGSLEREPGEDVGTYAILQGTLDAGSNYLITFNAGEFEIVKANQTITVTMHAPASAMNGDTFTVAATSSSGLAVVYSATGGCTNAGAVFTITSDSEACVVHYNQPGDDSFNVAPEIIETVTVSASEIAPVITLDPVDVTLTAPGQNAVFTADASGAPLPDVAWEVSTDGGANFSILPGEVSKTLMVINPPLSYNNYQYRAVFSNTAGTATTQAATLTISPFSLWLPFVDR